MRRVTQTKATLALHAPDPGPVLLGGVLPERVSRCTVDLSEVHA